MVDDTVIIADPQACRYRGNVEELVEEHSEELSTEQLQRLPTEQHRMTAEELSDKEGE